MIRATIVCLLMLLIILAAGRAPVSRAFINGRILTVDINNSVAQALLLSGNRVLAVGSTARILSMVTATTDVVDLQGAVVVPGFVDAHSHFPSNGLRQVSVDLSPPPIGDISGVEELLARIGTATKLQPTSQWLLGYNYDNTAFASGQHPTREQLDEVAPLHAVYLWHNSGHMGVANSAALLRLSIDDAQVVIGSSNVGRDVVSGQLNGLLQEHAAPSLARFVSDFSLLQKLAVLDAANTDYLQAGVTTLQNGYVGRAMQWALRAAQFAGLVHQRIVVWPAHAKQGATLLASDYVRTDSDVFRVGAVKLIVDGSPQGLTAFLSEPYKNASDRDVGYRGFALIELEELRELVFEYHKRNYQLALHGNGDAAIDYIIDAVAAAQERYPTVESRHILVHAQTLRVDQIEKLASLDLTPSLFNSHTYYWGDWHREQSLGEERASRISPAATLDAAGVKYSLHGDTPVTPMNPLQLMWSAVHRQTLSGFVLGPDERISSTRALRAVTIDAAWQSHLEDKVGSLEAGKLADFVVLSDDPHKVFDMRRIIVLNTIIDGKMRYRHAESILNF